MPHRHIHVAALAVLAGVALGGCAVTGEPQQVSLTTARPIGERPLTQTVVPRVDGFAAVTVTVGTYGVPSPDAVLRLEVEGSGTTREAFVDGATIAHDPAAVTFTFPPIEDAAGETFALTFGVEGADDVALFVNEHDPYPDGELSPGGGDLRFLVGHADRVGGTLAALDRVRHEAAGNLASDPGFTRVWALVVLALTAGLVGSVRREHRRAERVS